MKGVSCHGLQGCRWDRDRGDRPWSPAGRWEPARTPFQRCGGDLAEAGTQEPRVQAGRQWARMGERRTRSERERVRAAGPGAPVSRAARCRHAPAARQERGMPGPFPSGGSPVRGQPRCSGALSRQPLGLCTPPSRTSFLLCPLRAQGTRLGLSNRTPPRPLPHAPPGVVNLGWRPPAS